MNNDTIGHIQSRGESATCPVCGDYAGYVFTRVEWNNGNLREVKSFICDYCYFKQTGKTVDYSQPTIVVDEDSTEFLHTF